MKHAREDYQPIQDPSGKIPEEEPVFLIRGQDQLAPEVLRFYAEIYRDHYGFNELAEMVDAQAQAMECWQKEHGSKQPDL